MESRVDFSKKPPDLLKMALTGEEATCATLRSTTGAATHDQFTVYIHSDVLVDADGCNILGQEVADEHFPFTCRDERLFVECLLAQHLFCCSQVGDRRLLFAAGAVPVWLL